MITREPIFSALFNLLAAIPGLTTISRRFRGPGQVPPEDHPALFMVQSNQVPTQKGGCPPIWDLSVDVVLYTYQTDETASSAPQLNALMDALEVALAPDEPFSNRLTLGGLVQHAWLEGPVDVFEHALGPQSMIVSTIQIHVA